MNLTVYVSFWDRQSHRSEGQNQTEWRKDRIPAETFQRMKNTNLESP